jgi:hypothetical protein
MKSCIALTVLAAAAATGPYPSDYSDFNQKSYVGATDGAAGVLVDGTHAEVNDGMTPDTVAPTEAMDTHDDSNDATHHGDKHSFDVANAAGTDTHILDEEVGTHQHSDDADGSTGWTGTTSSLLNTTYNTLDNASQAPTKAPTAAPSYTHGTCTFDGTAVTRPVGWVGAGLAGDYCYQFTCNDNELMTSNKNATSPACGVPSGTDVCQNVFCELDTTDDMIHVFHKDGANFASTEGNQHHCKYDENAAVCTCHCHGANGVLWHDYQTWFCATSNGAVSMPTHVSYTAGDYSPASDYSVTHTTYAAAHGCPA